MPGFFFICLSAMRIRCLADVRADYWALSVLSDNIRYENPLISGYASGLLGIKRVVRQYPLWKSAALRICERIITKKNGRHEGTHSISYESINNYIAVYPPSTGRLTPVTYVEAGEARKQIAVSSSPSLPYLSRGIIVLAFCWKKSESSVSFVRGL